MSAGELLSRLAKEAQPKEDDSPEAQWNRQRASTETALIFELKDSQAFEWFFNEFVVKPFLEARRALLNEFAPSGHTPEFSKLHTTYTALRKIRVALIEREIVHRQQLDSEDHEILRLREIIADL